MVLRDRNHPSVILWSICNEEAIQGTPVAANIARAMTHEVKRLDPSRPVTAAVSGGLLNDDCIADAIEVDAASTTSCRCTTRFTRSIRDAADRRRDALRARRRAGRTRPTPTGSSLPRTTTRRAPWGATARETLAFVAARPFIAGLFAWTGFDYRGEPTPHGWPCVTLAVGHHRHRAGSRRTRFLHKAFFTASRSSLCRTGVRSARRL